ncbi:MAG: leucine-rich repeat protein [Candidatus Izemoplasmataceae bacterium]
MKNVMKIGVIIMLFFLVGCEENIVEDETAIVSFDTTFEENVQAVEIEKGDTLDNLPELQRSGHYFLGWYLEDNLFDQTLPIEEDIVLTARFENYMDVYDYELRDGQVIVLAYNGELKELVIPELIDGYTVYAIAEQAFMDTDIQRIEVPVSVIYIGFDAFRNTKDLKELSFYGTYQGEVEATLSQDAYDEWLTDYHDVCEKEEDPEHPNDESKWIFRGDCPIKKVTGQTEPVVVDGKEYIAYYVVMDLAYYETLNYRNKIGFNAFYGSAIEIVHLPSRYYIYDPLHFEGASELKEIIIDENNQRLSSIGGIIFNKDGDELYYYPTAKLGSSYTVDAGVELRFSALAYAKHLEMIEVEEGHTLYTSIDGVLYNAEMDTIITYPSGKIASGFEIPEGVETIGPKAFYGATFLEHIVLPYGLITIRELAFESTSLTSLRIPDSVKFIGGYIFKDVETLQDIVFEGSVSNDNIPTLLSSPFYINFEDSIYENVKIFVPDDSIDEYKLLGELRHMRDKIFPLSQRE